MVDLKITTGFSAIHVEANFFSMVALSKASKGLTTHIFNVSEEKSVITAKCQPAMSLSKEPYVITLRVNID